MEFAPRPEQMDDPLVVDWVVEALKLANEARDIGRASQLARLLNDEVLHRVLFDRGPTARFLLLEAAPADRLASVAAELLDRWTGWTDGSVPMVARSLAEHVPDELCRQLVDLLDEKGPSVCLNHVLEGIAALGPRASEVLPGALERVAARFEPERMPAAVCAAIKAGDPDAAVDVLCALATSESADPISVTDAVDDALAEAFSLLAPEAPYYDHFRDVQRGETDLWLQDMGMLFEPDAPLSELDDIVVEFPSGEDDDPTGEEGGRWLAEAEELLPGGAPEPPVVRFARRLSRELGGFAPHTDQLVAAFVLGAVAAAHTRETFDEVGSWSPEDLIELMTVDLALNPALDALASALDRMPPAHQVFLLTGADRVARGYGSVTVAQLMGRAGLPQLVLPLIHAMGADSVAAEAAGMALVRLGEVAERELLACWELLDSSQQIYGDEVLAQVGGDATVELLLHRLPEIKGDALELDSWCHLALMLPDERLVDALEGQLLRGLPAVEEAYVTLCALLDRSSDTVDRLRDKLERGRTRAEEATERLLAGEFPGPRETVSLDLRCPDCDEVCRHELRRVVIAINDPEAGPYIGDDITCPACGGDGPFEADGAMSQIGLMASLLPMLGPGGGNGAAGPVRHVNAHQSDGREAAPITTVKAYRARLAERPDSIPDLVGLGNIYSNLGPARLAVSCYERALELDPGTVEAATGLAELVEDDGDRRGAFDVMRRAHAARSSWRYHRLEKGTSRAMAEESFEALYNDLAETLGEPPLPRKPGRVRAAPGSLKQMDMLTSPAAPIRRGPKVGRNDPCPCGSGKKYKKCCLKKG